MKKIILPKYVRFSLIISAAFLIAILSFLIFKILKIPAFEEKKVSLYGYKHNSQIGYNVILKPNFLFASSIMDEDNTYISTFVDRINTVFKYEFSGDIQADINGTYEILAVIEGFISNEEGKSKTIWKKEFSLVPITSFQMKSKNFKINKDVFLNFQQYDNFARQVLKDSEVNSQVKISVLMDINLSAQTNKGLLKDKISPSIVIPLNTKYFEITKHNNGEKLGAIEETRKYKIPVNKQIVLTYCVFLILTLFILIFLAFFTKGVFEKNPLLINLNKIFKNHGNRLVALNGEITGVFDNSYKVRSIDDMVRVADEVGKPIMYKYSSEFKEITHFYVIEDRCIYVLDLNDEIVRYTTEAKQESVRIENFGKIKKLWQ